MWSKQFLSKEPGVSALRSDHAADSGGEVSHHQHTDTEEQYRTPQSDQTRSGTHTGMWSDHTLVSSPHTHTQSFSRDFFTSFLTVTTSWYSNTPLLECSLNPSLINTYFYWSLKGRECNTTTPPHTCTTTHTGAGSSRNLITFSLECFSDQDVLLVQKETHRYRFRGWKAEKVHAHGLYLFSTARLTSGYKQIHTSVSSRSRCTCCACALHSASMPLYSFNSWSQGNKTK